MCVLLLAASCLLSPCMQDQSGLRWLMLRHEPMLVLMASQRLVFELGCLPQLEILALCDGVLPQSPPRCACTEDAQHPNLQAHALPPAVTAAPPYLADNHDEFLRPCNPQIISLCSSLMVAP